MRRGLLDRIEIDSRKRAVHIGSGIVAFALFLSLWQALDGRAAPSTQTEGPRLSCNCPPGDWPSIDRFKRDNRTALSQSPSMHHVVFLGDSITEHWIILRPSFFGSHGFLDRGIYGQTTPQILLRLRPDAVALAPKVVVILAGTNDLAGNTGPEGLDYIEGNLASMVEIARANKIAVVLSSVLPVNDVYTPRTSARRPEDIYRLNQWMSQYCAAGSCIYLDYFNRMIDGHGYLRAGLTDDGLHPNAAGYEIMEPLVENAIEQSLRR
jgi:lysophospholipase L1-like esterase